MRLDLVVKVNKLPGAPDAMRRAVGRAFADVRPDLLADMQRRTPRDTGALVGSETAVSDETSLTLTAGGGLPDGRAIFVHQGTRRMPARPYMRDAIEANAGRIADALASATEAGLR